MAQIPRYQGTHVNMFAFRAYLIPNYKGERVLVRIEGKMNGEKYREILDENLLQSALGQCPWVAQPEPWLEPDRISLERPEDSCAAMLPIQPDRARGSAEKNGRNSPNTGVPNLKRWLNAVIAAKGASTKYWVKSRNTYVNVICFLFVIICKHSKNLFSFVIMGYCV